jgi:D-alanyl-D-alanine carboxypeptidase/D-alanyl-D-alanine-endopeptidase (penicillin-binding protein 4)
MHRVALALFLAFALAAAGCTTTPVSRAGNATADSVVAIATSGSENASPVAAAFSNLTAKPAYGHATWGALVVDLDNGTTLFEHNPDAMLIPGSTTKMFTSAAALAALEPYHRFETPVFLVNGTLVLVASGDLTLGGRTRPDGTIEITSVDHGDANALGGAELTRTDPLAGLRALARQVKAAGIETADDVVIDDRLFDLTDNGKEFVVSPIVVNDNLVDLTVIGNTTAGAPATVLARPATMAFRVVANVTSTSGLPAALEIASNGPGVITVEGSVPAGTVTNRTWSVRDPAAFARTLFIEALEAEGVGIRADATGRNAAHILPATYTGAERVALHVSPPFSEDVKLTLKLSQNLHADSYILLIAAASGKRTFAEGMALERRPLEGLGVDLDGLVLMDGEGSTDNRISPRAAVQLLRGQSRSFSFEPFYEALPILGRDGSLADALPSDHPAAGRVRAKTGTSIGADYLNERMLLSSKALAGYADCASGRRVAFAVTVNNVGIGEVADGLAVGNDLGAFAAELQQAF